ncbi:DinB family protein [Alteromonas sp. CI.11.F.A3]|uniref:DinB family protein n=1 Tax=unclassified Alteromonas TaxID=2614992 RepID=UPI001B39D8AC|nr:DinB family protein [Alteromonas sp. CI.11.F.A3]MBQ4830113.1 DinB family protein [Alteromonas sp. MMG017]WOI35571.1 DinB family protein [Alteromonas sp. CI.11.F.A3]
MSLKNSFTLMAQYNQWMNESVYSAALQLSPAELSEDVGAFFGSILGTLNHILVADIIWLQRFAQHPDRFSELDSVIAMPLPKKLDETLFDDIALLREQRVKVDEAILAFANALSSEVLTTDLSFHDTAGVPHTKNFGQLILHLFNHQTHHRGQITTLLSQRGVDVGATDLLEIIPEIKNT